MSSSNKIALSIIIGAFLIAVALYFGLKQGLKKNQYVANQNTKPLTTPTIVTPTPEKLTPTSKPSPTPSPTPEIVWTKEDILNALHEKTGIDKDKINFGISKKIDKGDKILLRGGVSEKGAMGGALFFAVVDKDGVKVTFAGNGVPLCSEVEPYGYPLSWADYCIDENGNTVKRSTP